MPRSRKLRTFQATLVAAALTAGGALAAAPGAQATTQTDVPELSVLSHNVFLFSKTLYPNWGQEHRASTIPTDDYFQGHDVVVVQEAFDNAASGTLMNKAAAAYPHQTPVLGRSKSGWDATHGAYSSFTPEDGGVTILSKWPIVRKEQFVYKEGCGADWYSNKGFVYSVLDVNGTKVHVVGTHAQSTDPGCSAGQAERVRSAQFKEMNAFLNAKRIPANEQVIVAGDFNVDSHTAEYASMLRDAGLVDTDHRTGLAYSFDTRDNSIARDRYPSDPRENLDHVLHRAGHARPAGWTNHVVDERSAPWTVTSWGKSYTYTNMSDHYPVTGSAR
ncbi:sphingomyelin phosphodiesterase [Streptomyces alkaliterrae]|uniref:Sphingomyelin phosphodiesterase n=1 Tax=Streptomyces alkaliterrae TaxID=2213162 RepID=A0A5P0YSE1_9ACTN|nr:sphingomyelin phosphodiesterase [Streptomyces alkaliterrae]MQS03188.1 sphingomyelin phosphodiesterase [Streptomyces alkaliterrae]